MGVDSNAVEARNRGAGALTHSARRRAWLADVTLGAVVFVVGLSTVATYGYDYSTALPAPAMAAVAVALRRRAPAVSLLVVGVSGLLQRSSGTPLSAAQVAAFVVLYSSAAYGRRATVWFSGAVVLALTAIALRYSPVGYSLHLVVAWTATSETPDVGRQAVIWLIILFGSAPTWLGGLVRRAVLARRADAAALLLAQSESARSAAIAAAQQQRAALARDVHDVVGHSLAVIIALSESVRFRDLTDDQQIAEAVQTVAMITDSARESLAMVRGVLSDRASAREAEDVGSTTSLLELFSRVRNAGLTLQVTHLGEPRDLPEQHRRIVLAVIQELLTNALHHADTTRPVALTQTWTSDELVIEVGTAMRHQASDQTLERGRTGLGLPGIRARLDEIGGTLSIRTDSATVLDAGWYISQARIPFAHAPQRSPELNMSTV